MEKLSNQLYHDFQYTISNQRLGSYFIIAHKYIKYESLFSGIIFKIKKIFQDKIQIYSIPFK